MRALFLDESGHLALAERRSPSSGAECLVRVRRAGICGTDLQLLAGYADFTGIPGHEFVGIVEQAPDGRGALVGRRVVGEINVGCGSCTWCARGEKEHCPQRTVMGIRHRDGAFAELLLLPDANLHAVPDDVSDEEAVFAEPLAAACRILAQVTVNRSTCAIVVGDGRLGLLVAQVLRATGAHVVVAGKHEPKLAVARQLELSTVRVGDALADAERFDVVVDASGRTEGLHAALRLVRPRGVVVLKSTFHGETTLAPWPIVVDEVSVVGSRCGPFRAALDLLARRKVHVMPLIDATFPLEGFAEAFERARAGLKVLIEP
jgi:threonine dehydrogenase-like Zn-dependent dehydrogenase